MAKSGSEEAKRKAEELKALGKQEVDKLTHKAHQSSGISFILVNLWLYLQDFCLCALPFLFSDVFCWFLLNVQF